MAIVGIYVEFLRCNLLFVFVGDHLRILPWQLTIKAPFGEWIFFFQASNKQIQVIME